MVGIGRETLEQVGALDEQFWPGGYEDDDYCRRAVKAKRTIGISEGTFVFHFGSASFGQFAMEQRLDWDAENRARFERLHGLFQTRAHEIAERAQSDAARRVELLSGILVDCTTDERRVIVTTLGLDIAHLANAQEPLAELHPPKPPQAPPRRSIIRRLLDLARNSVEVFRVARPLRADVLVLAGRFPRDSDMSDGYFVRVRLIDQLMEKSGLSRVYLHMGAATNEAHFVSPTAVELRVTGRLSSGIALTMLMLNTRFTYAHSILRLSRRILSFISITKAKLILDVHGAVPEESSMQGDTVSARLLDDVERRALTMAREVLCVTSEMSRHLATKHGIPETKFTVLPIFDLSLTTDASTRFEKRTTDFAYVGGLQPWQNLGAIRDRIVASGDLFSWKLIVPDPREMLEQFPELAGFKRVTVISARGSDLGKHLRVSKFGLLPRERSVVNSVAFPTKIVDYLSFGCIPATLNSPIGGIADLGVRRQILPGVVNFRDFTITKDDWEKKAQANRDVFSNLESIVNSTSELFFSRLK
jgi:hypothetical protein